MFRKTTLLCALLLVSAAITAPLGSAHQTSEQFVIVVNSDGSAQISHVVTYNLENETERQAFNELKTNNTAESNRLQQYVDRLSGYADNSPDASSDDIRSARIYFQTDDDSNTGVVSLYAEWHSFGTVSDGTITVTNPLPASFNPDKQVVVAASRDLTLDSASPVTDGSTTRGSVIWSSAANPNLDNIEITFTTGTTKTTESQPTSEDTADTTASTPSDQSSSSLPLIVGGAVVVIGGAAAILIWRQ